MGLALFGLRLYAISAMRRHYRKATRQTSSSYPHPVAKSAEEQYWDARMDKEVGKVPQPGDLGPSQEEVPFLPAASVSQCTCAPPWITVTDPKTGKLGIEVCDVCMPQRIAEGHGQFHYVLSYLGRDGVLKRYEFPSGRYGYAFARVFNDRANVKCDLRARVLEAAVLDFPLKDIGNRTELRRCSAAARVVHFPVAGVRYIYREAMAEVKHLSRQRLTGQEPIGRWPWRFLNAKQRSYCIRQERQRAQDQKLIRICELLSPLPPPNHRILDSDLRRALVEVRERLMTGDDRSKQESLRGVLNEYEKGLGDALKTAHHLRALILALTDPELSSAS